MGQLLHRRQTRIPTQELPCSRRASSRMQELQVTQYLTLPMLRRPLGLPGFLARMVYLSVSSSNGYSEARLLLWKELPWLGPLPFLVPLLP